LAGVRTVDDFLGGANEHAAALFRRFQQLVEACGPIETSVSRTVVYFKRSRVFAGGFVRGRKLEIVIDLLRTVEHPLLLSSFHTTKKVVSHRLRISETGQLDDSIQALLHEAYADVGPGTRGG